MTAKDPLRAQIVEVAEGILSGEVGMLEGCRRLAHLSKRLEDNVGEDLFTPIKAIDSETDDFPLGEARSYWSQKALERKDAELATYLTEVRNVIRSTCEALVKRFCVK